jgi:hypothetical protein
MRTSNYIIAGFLTFVFVIILSMFIDAKLHGKTSKKKTFVTAETLDYFTVIVAEEESDISILFGSENAISSQIYALEQPKNQQSPKKFYRISNDTMFVQKAYSVDRLVINSNYIKKIIGKKNAKISIWYAEKDSLSLDLDHSKLEWSANNDHLNYLDIVARNHSNIQFIPTINYVRDEYGNKKRVYKEGLKYVKVSLKNHSKLNMRKPRRLDIQADTTSNYTLF